MRDFHEIVQSKADQGVPVNDRKEDRYMIKTAVIGVGNMGSKYASIIQDGMIRGMELSAIKRSYRGHRIMLMFLHGEIM